MTENKDETTNPKDRDEIEQLRADGQDALAQLFLTYRPRLERMVEFRLDRRLYGRVDAADILQEAYLEISKRLASYLEEPRVSFFVWARQMTWQTLISIHRSNFGVQKRDAARDIQLHGTSYGNETAVSLASKLVGNLTSPSQGAIRDERAHQLRNALESMDKIDREVLALRHFEHLSNKETAEVLEIQKTAASNRYIRALDRLRSILDEVMGEQP